MAEPPARKRLRDLRDMFAPVVQRSRARPSAKRAGGTGRRPLAEAPRKPRKRDLESVATLHALANDWAAVFRHNAAAAGAGVDVEFVHQARVASRRLRALLALLADLEAAPQAATRRSQRTEIRWAAGALGEVRDLDVLATEVLPRLQAAMPEADLGDIADGIKRSRSAAQNRLGVILASPRFMELSRDLAASFGATPSADAAPAHALLHRVARRITRQFDRCLRHVHAPRKMSDEELHRLRVEVKKFRYLAELVAPQHPVRACKSALETLADVQRRLGDFQDLCSARALLHKAIRQETPQEGTPGEHVRALLAEWRETARREAARSVHDLRDITPFWRQNEPRPGKSDAKPARLAEGGPPAQGLDPDQARSGAR